MKWQLLLTMQNTSPDFFTIFPENPVIIYPLRSLIDESFQKGIQNGHKGIGIHQDGKGAEEQHLHGVHDVRRRRHFRRRPGTADSHQSLARL